MAKHSTSHLTVSRYSGIVGWFCEVEFCLKTDLTVKNYTFHCALSFINHHVANFLSCQLDIVVIT